MMPRAAGRPPRCFPIISALEFRNGNTGDQAFIASSCGLQHPYNVPTAADRAAVRESSNAY
jgi:hypothetical protein